MGHSPDVFLFLDKMLHIFVFFPPPPPELERAKTDPRARLKRVNAETKEALAELDATYKAPEKKDEDKREVADKFNAAPYSTGRVAASFTSTAMTRETVHQAAMLEEDVVRYARVKKKGYVRLMTNVGPLNLELHCEYVPKTCENFMKLCQKDYYNGTKFHRSIKHFMVSGKVGFSTIFFTPYSILPCVSHILARDPGRRPDWNRHRWRVLLGQTVQGRVPAISQPSGARHPQHGQFRTQYEQVAVVSAAVIFF